MGNRWSEGSSIVSNKPAHLQFRDGVYVWNPAVRGSVNFFFANPRNPLVVGDYRFGFDQVGDFIPFVLEMQQQFGSTDGSYIADLATVAQNVVGSFLGEYQANLVRLLHFGPMIVGVDHGRMFGTLFGDALVEKLEENNFDLRIGDGNDPLVRRIGGRNRTDTHGVVVYGHPSISYASRNF